LTQGNPRDDLFEAFPMLRRSAGQSQIGIDDFNVFRSPPEVQGALFKGILQA
jgi:hypothetical protein